MKWRFIFYEAVHILKIVKLELLMITPLLIAFLILPSIARIHLALRDVPMPPGVEPAFVAATMEAVLAMGTLAMGLYLALLIVTFVDPEKTDKIFEHIFMMPTSPLRVVLYRFAASALIMMLLFPALNLASCLIVFCFTGYVDLIHMFKTIALTIVFTLPIAYLMYLVTMILPLKFVGAVRFSIFIFIIVAPFNVMILTPIGELGIPGLFAESLLLSSSAVAVTGLIITAAVRNRLSERTITT